MAATLAVFAWVALVLRRRRAQSALGRVRAAAREAIEATRRDPTLERVRAQVHAMLARAEQLDQARRACAARLVRIDRGNLERRREAMARSSSPEAAEALAWLTAECAEAERLQSDLVVQPGGARTHRERHARRVAARPRGSWHARAHRARGSGRRSRAGARAARRGAHRGRRRGRPRGPSLTRTRSRHQLCYSCRHDDARPLRALTHGLPPHRRGPHGAVQLALGPQDGRGVRPAHRGHQSGAQHRGERARHLRGHEVAGAHVGRGSGRGRCARAVHADGAARDLQGVERAAHRERARLPLLL